MQAFLRKSLIVSVLALGVAVIGQNASADPGDNLHWKSVIGILAPGNVVGSGTAKAQARRDRGRRRAAASASIWTRERSISPSVAWCLPPEIPSGLRARSFR